MRSRVLVVLGLCAAVGGCETSGDNMMWVRHDGATSAAAARQFQIDQTICIGEVQRAAAGAPIIYYQGMAGALGAISIQMQYQQLYKDIMRGCMAQRGYALIPNPEKPKANSKPHPGGTAARS